MQNVTDMGTPKIIAISNRDMRSDHLTNQCHRKEISSVVRCVFCGRNNATYYKGCTVYKDVPKTTYQTLLWKYYTLPEHMKQILNTQPGVTHAKITYKIPIF
jgi:hypothetical protein